MSITDLEKVEPPALRADTLTLDIEPAKPREENIFAIDYYEILRVGPHADEDTIERVYRTLERRFQPDNPSTGDAETFLRLREAYETLSNPARRAKYNALRQYTGNAARFWLRGREFFDSVRGGQNRRLAVLCLLYRQRISTHESPGLTTLDLERLTGCTREELAYALWYLCEKKWAKIGEFTAYSITADGFDVVESKLEDRLEFRALATLCYYGLPAELEVPARVGPRFWKNYTLSSDIEPAGAIEEGVFLADHYEVLGIGPQADEEDIERVYQTLADRFHPDNPGTGDAKMFLRIREAYETLSDPGKRGRYNAHRQRSNYSARFRLRGREFFDGIRGEQLRRLAVLCLLYRQTANELPGLTVLDLEQLTGCTREELGSALWYIREKKWAKSGAFTEYSITAAGFDVVEDKLEEREAARSRAWPDPGDAPGEEFVYPQISAAQPTGQSQQNVSGGTDNTAEEPPAQRVEAAPGPVPAEDAPGVAVPVSRLDDARDDQFVYSLVRAAQAVERTQLGAPAPQPEASSAVTAEDRNLHWMAESEQTDLKAREPSNQNMEIAQEPILMEVATARAGDRAEPDDWEAPDVWACLYPDDTYGNGLAYPNEAGATHAAAQSRANDEVTLPGSLIENASGDPDSPNAGVTSTDSQAEQPSNANVEFARGTPCEAGAEPAAESQPNVEFRPKFPGVGRMNNAAQAIAEPAGGVAVRAEKRVVFSMGGKGGVGKTNVMTGLAEWFGENRIPVTLLDLDTENKARGSLTHFFGGSVPKINIHTPAGLDAFVDILAEDAPAILADMGAGAGQITHDWFDKMYPDVAQVGIVFTAIGVVTSDPASVESVLNWAAALQDRVDYVIVENNLTERTDFSYWQESDQAVEFRKRFQPAIIRLDCRLADLENAIRNYGVTLGQVAGRATSAPELQKASLVMRAQSYRRRMFAEFDKVKELFLP